MWLQGQTRLLARTHTEPKTVSGRRKIELPRIALEALIRHKERIRQETSVETHPKRPVFTDTCGGMLRKSNLRSRSFARLLKKAGLPHIRFHDLRHTAASMLALQNAHPKTVQSLLGHSRISVTPDTYSHLFPTMQREAANKMDELLGGAKRLRTLPQG
jgi:integrase